MIQPTDRSLLPTSEDKRVNAESGQDVRVNKIGD